jgi:amidase
VLLYEFKADLNAYLAWLGPASPVHSLKDVIAFNERAPRSGDAVLRPGDLGDGREEGPLTTPAYRAALAKCHRMARTLGIDAVMAQAQARRAGRADRGRRG